MKKQLKYILSIGAIFVMGACHKLAVPPLNIITEGQVFSTANGVEAYLADIYTNLPMEDFVYEPNSGFMTGNGGRWQCFYHTDAIDGEMAGPFGGTGDAATGFGFWPYAQIRNINILLYDLPQYASLYSPAQLNEWLGEAYFCRAYTYFALVKRYGGIPIVRTVINPSTNIDSLQVPRNKEEDVYNFIGSDFDSAYALMWEPGVGSNPAAQAGAASKYAAPAYKSLAMLYAATIAKYGSTNFVAGQAQSAGFVGIPAGDANTFFQESIAAAKLVQGQFSLYTAEPDKEQNYADLFLTPNNEWIFIRQYTISDPDENNDNAGPHSWDATMTNREMTANGLSRTYPDYDYVERYGELPIVNADGTPTRFNNLSDLLTLNLEPRLLATVYFPGMTLRGYTFDQQRGIYKTFTGSAAQELSDNLNTPNDVNATAPGDVSNANLVFASGPTYTYNGHAITGVVGFNPSTGDDNTRTGFYIRKYVNYNAPISACNLYQSTQSYIDMRYAEVLLNLAEADFETGNNTEALGCINQIRDRAGAPEASLGTMTIDTIRNERDKELAFEHQYWWDIRRWRIADQVLDNRKLYALCPYWIATENKYIFLKQVEPFQRVYTFQKNWYYEPLPGGELAKNPNLYPNNPGY
jgi:hypothetical protein